MSRPVLVLGGGVTGMHVATALGDLGHSSILLEKTQELGGRVRVAEGDAQIGADACNLLRGTFVVVAADRERNTATVLRDHRGGRPLVHIRIGDGALFSEHERGILDLLPQRAGGLRLIAVRAR